MDIILDDVGRRFNRDWIFKHLSYHFKHGESYAILGPNGSGKSTLTSLISGHLSPSEGNIHYKADDKPVPPEQIYQHISFAAPYLDLIEEFNLSELIDFHFQFKPIAAGLNKKMIIDLLQLNVRTQKTFRYFSSGMKQRVRLALACCADTPLLFLDEPCSNLDAQGIDWYLHLIHEFGDKKMLVISSNQNFEYDFCKHQIDITHYKA